MKGESLSLNDEIPGLIVETLSLSIETWNLNREAQNLIFETPGLIHEAQSLNGEVQTLNHLSLSLIVEIPGVIGEKQNLTVESSYLARDPQTLIRQTHVFALKVQPEGSQTCNVWNTIDENMSALKTRPELRRASSMRDTLLPD